MGTAILLAVAASLCTATASVCQRAGARNTGPAAGFDARLIVRLARQPAWLLGIAAMIGGFVFQLTALRFGELALVQPILAAELLFVFGYLAVAGSRRPKLRDWLAAAAMSAGIGLFLRLASPSGGRLHAPGSSWLLAGLVTAAVVLAALAGEALALAMVIAGATALSRSSLLHGDNPRGGRDTQVRSGNQDLDTERALVPADPAGRRVSPGGVVPPSRGESFVHVGSGGADDYRHDQPMAACPPG